MRIFAATVLILVMMFHSVETLAAPPIPFRELSRSAAPLPSAQSTPAASVPTQPVRSRPMTRGGKIMVGVGIGFLGIGAGLIGIGASTDPHDFLGSTARGVGFGAGTAFAGVGGALIYVGAHRRVEK